MLTTMDILKPEIINIEGRRYRKPPVKNESRPEEENHRESYQEEDYYDDEGESCEMEYESIEKYEGGYRDYIKDIPSFYFRFVVGTGNEKRKSLEKQTRTSIQVPKVGQDGDIVITGKDRNGVLAAKTKLKTIITMNRGEQPANHFLSISLASSELKENFEDFKKKVLEIKSRGVDASLFQLPERLHLTLCLLTFLNDAELNDSLSQLNEIVKELWRKHFGEAGVLKIRIQGIEYMNDDPGEVDVLYAKVNLIDGSKRLQEFSDKLVSTLVVNGFLKQQYDRVKLHATVINSLFRDDGNRGNSATKGGNKKHRITFNAEPVLKMYSDFFFADVEVSSLDVSLRKHFGPDGCYSCVATISLT